MATLYTHIKTVLYSIIFVVVVLNAFFLLSTPTAHSSATDNLTGYAWSDTIGWISFNSTNEAGPTADYGVTVAGDGDMSGYAWSEHIGWISFNEAGCPSGTCAPHFDKVTGVVTGWARALSPTTTVNTGGWDGWISLSGTTVDGNSYGVVVTGADWEGFAWGSDVVGWISFGGAFGGNVTGMNDDSIQRPAPAVTVFKVCDSDGVSNCVSETDSYPKLVAPSAPLKVTWDSNNTNWCEAVSGTGFETGASKPISDTDDAISTSVQSTSEVYEIRCGYGGDILGSDSAAVTVETTQVILSVSPRTVEAGSQTTLSWDTGVVEESTCTLQGGSYTNDSTPFTADDGVGDDLFKGSIPITVNARTTYTITCGALTDTETVEIVPRGTET